MLPEIEFIRASPTPVSPEQCKLEFPERTNAVDMSIKRALSAGKIKRVSTGLYAHPKYVSPIDRDKPIPTPTPNDSGWKTSIHASLIHITLKALYEDIVNNNAYHYLDWIRPEIWRIMRETWSDEQIRNYAKYLVQAANELSTDLDKKLIPGITQQDVYRAIKDNVNLGGYGD